MMSLTGWNGICTSQRTPALSVSVGVTRHESCTNSEYSFMPARLTALAEVDVLIGRLVEHEVAADAVDAAGEQRVERTGVGRARGRRAREVRRREQR